MTQSNGVRKRWPKEYDAIILRLAREGVWPASIQARLGVDIFKVRKVLRKAGFKYPHEVRSAIMKETRRQTMPDYAPDTTDQILKLRQEGLSRKDIAASVGVSIDKVHSDIQKYGGGPLEHLRLNQVASATKYDPSQREEVLARRRRGEKVEDIVGATGLSPSTVRYLSAGVCLSEEQRAANVRRIHPREMDDRIVERRKAGDSREKIAADLGVPLSKVKTVLHDRGVRMPGLRTVYSWEDVRQVCRELEMEPLNLPEGEGKVCDTFSHEWRIRCHCGREYAPYLNSFVRRMSRSCGCVKSHAEGEVADFVSALGFEAIRHDRKQIAPLEFDLWIPSRRLAIEYNGLFWHGERMTSTRGRQGLAFVKWKKAQALGIRLVTIFEDEWVSRRSAVEGFLRAILGVPGDSIGARECSLVSGRNESAFLDQNHLQGSVAGRTWSLLGPDGRTAACAVFAAPNASRGARPEGQGIFELLRYCVRSGLRVSGGLGRLLAAFRKEVSAARRLVSYSDNRWSQGGVYRALGFSSVGETLPSYWYFRAGSQGPRFHRFTWRKQRALEEYGGDPVRTEWEIMSENGWDRVWDCGTTKWVLDLPL